MLTVSILGCGWFGLALAKKLLENGYVVKGSTTSPEKLSSLRKVGIESYLVDFSTEEVYSTDFFDCAVLFIAIPPKRKMGEASLYSKKIESVLQAAKGRSKQVILISSTGVFENSNKQFTELDIPQPNTESGKVLLAAENIAKEQRGITTTILRFGGLYGPDRNPGRFFAGKKNIANGLAPVNMIHLNDCLGISLGILEKKAFGNTYNACAPQHPSRADFYTMSAKMTGLELPHFIPELLNWKIVDSVNIQPLLNYQFLEKLYNQS